MDTSPIVEFIDITFTPLIQFLLEEILEYYFCATIFVTILIWLRWRQNDKTSVVVHLVEGVEKWEDRKYFSFPSCCLIWGWKSRGIENVICIKKKSNKLGEKKR